MLDRIRESQLKIYGLVLDRADTPSFTASKQLFGALVEVDIFHDKPGCGIISSAQVLF